MVLEQDNQTTTNHDGPEQSAPVKTHSPKTREHNTARPSHDQTPRTNKGPDSRNNFRTNKPKSGRNDHKKNHNNKEKSDFTEKVIWVRRINKVTTGGRRLRFAACVAVGNEKGKVGIFNAKAYEVSEAIKKAIAGAHKNLQTVAISENDSIYHSGIGTYCASRILLKPAKEGIGVKAGGAAREIIELAGIKNIYSKSLGSNNKINLARATLSGLTSLKPATYFQEIHDKSKSPEASKLGKK